MFGRPSVSINRVDKIQVDIPHDPFFHEMMYRKYMKDHISTYGDHFIAPPYFLNEAQKPYWMRYIDAIGKIISLVSGLAVIVFVALILAGKTTVASLNVTNLLAIFSFTLFGGIVSVGGVNMFSLSANLRKANEDIASIQNISGGCPFVRVVDDEAKIKYGIENPYKIANPEFCHRCQLIDHKGRTICKITPSYSG